MSVNLCRTRIEDRELALERPFSSAPERLFEARTEPRLLAKWFAPKPWSVADARRDLRIGSSSRIVMRSPDGAEFPNTGVYLEIEPGRRLVVTDAYLDAWTPSRQPFMTLVLDFLPHAGGTLNRARVLHWSAADREKHEAMGFHEGWPICTERLAALVETTPDVRSAEMLTLHAGAARWLKLRPAVRRKLVEIAFQASFDRLDIGNGRGAELERVAHAVRSLLLRALRLRDGRGRKRKQRAQHDQPRRLAK
jgi:uncharacterized protein YndB with AHSA1/START domain